MKITYNSYTEILHILQQALKGLAFGLTCSLWAIVLLVINSVVYAFRKVSAAIKGYPVAAVIVLLFALAISNIMIYASMKAKLVTAEWRYDKLEMHVDSIYEAYNIQTTYSRLQK